MQTHKRNKRHIHSIETCSMYYNNYKKIIIYGVIGNLMMNMTETSTDIQSPSSSSNSKIIKNKKWYYKISNWIRIIILLFMATILTFAIVKGDVTVYIVKSFLEWVKTHIILGSFAFIGLYILCNLVMIPGFLLTVGAGYLFVNLLDAWYGIFIAIFIVCISRFLGWTFSFLAARYLFKSSVHSLMNKSQKLLLSC